MCSRLPRTGCSCCSLTTTGTAEDALELEVEQGLAAGEHGADLAFARLERARLAAAAVDDPGHEALAPQPARAARAELRAGSHFQGFASTGHRIGEDRETSPPGPVAPFTIRPMADESKIPKGRIRRSAKLGSVVGVQGARYAGTKATNVARSEEGGREKLEQRHLETAIKMVGALGQMKGAAMKLGQFASFIDTEFIPEEYREIYQEQLAKLRTDAPSMPWEKVEKVLEEEYDDEPLDELFAEFEQEAFAAASIGQVHRATLLDGATGRGQGPVPGDRRGARLRPPQRRDDGPPRPRPRARAGREGDSRTRSASG